LNGERARGQATGNRRCNCPSTSDLAVEITQRVGEGSAFAYPIACGASSGGMGAASAVWWSLFTD